MGVRRTGHLLILALALLAGIPSFCWGFGFSADFNGDTVVDAQDAAIFLTNNPFPTTFAGGDANGDGEARFLGDWNVLLCQWSTSPVGNPILLNGQYNPITGIVNVTIPPGISGMYLVNTNANNTISSNLPGTGDLLAAPVGFPATSMSLSYGGINPFTSTTYQVTVPIGTPVTDLWFFSQKIKHGVKPVTITDTVNSTIFTPTRPSAVCSCSPCDLNNDGIVDAADFALMFQNWGNSGIGDVNGDSIVDAADAGLCFTEWGPVDAIKGAGVASASYDPATGAIQVDVNQVVNWYVESASAGLTGLAPSGLEAANRLITDNDSRIGQTSLSPFSYQANLGAVARTGLAAGDLTLYWNAGLGEALQSAPLSIVPEPTFAAPLVLIVAMWRVRRRLAPAELHTF